MDILYVLLVIGVLIESIVAHNFLKRSIFDMLTNNGIDNQLKYILEENNLTIAKMKIKIYTGSSIESATITDIPINEPGMIYENIDNTKPLAMYIHGYREHPSNESVQTVIRAYLDRGTDNILLVDWSDLSFDNYIILIQKIKDMARIVSDSISSLVELGLDLENFHLIGHSMGAQMAGFIGRYTKYELPRITGLDPASPGFYYARAEHINNKSARFVDILHTDGGFYGASDNTGTADFFANGGKRPQPGCPLLGIPLTRTDLCSHWRSWRIYAESIKNIFSFPAVQCSSYLDYTEGRCEKNQVIYFGYSTPTNARGSYFFKTNEKSPYGRSL